ncbi:MAG: hypothetical protein V4553_18070 [Bacteroidota bacterium]
MDKEERVSLKKQWERPKLFVMSAPVEGGNNPNVNEATAQTSASGPAGPGHPGQQVFDPANIHYAPDWTHAHS